MIRNGVSVACDVFIEKDPVKSGVRFPVSELFEGFAERRGRRG